VSKYTDIMSCAQSMNQGIGVGATCDAVTPVLASLMTATASPDHVSLAWFVSSGPCVLERLAAGSAWTRVAMLVPDGLGHVSYEDRAVVPGGRYGYRLTLAGSTRPLDEVWVGVPIMTALGLAGFRPNPAGLDASVAFTLPRRAPAVLELIDVAGRRVLSRDVGSLGPGSHVVRLDEAGRLPAGVYHLRLRQNGESIVRRAVLVR
jgi:hypothetical protein